MVPPQMFSLREVVLLPPTKRAMKPQENTQMHNPAPSAHILNSSLVNSFIANHSHETAGAASTGQRAAEQPGPSDKKILIVVQTEGT